MSCVDVTWGHLAARAQRDEDGCLLWTAATDRKGYGKLQVAGRHFLAHRLAYAVVVAPIPDGWHIDHLCRRPACIEPMHLEAVTPRENTLRGENHVARLAARESCDRGHPLTGANLLLRSNGERVCRTCKRAYDRQWHQDRRDGERVGAEVAS